MNVEVFMQYITYALIAIGVLACATSLITQTIKDIVPIKSLPTSLVAFLVALVVTCLAVVIACEIFAIQIVWYYIVGAVFAAFLVYLVATGGWERVKEIWERTKYKEA